jgi:hypothetical protein
MLASAVSGSTGLRVSLGTNPVCATITNNTVNLQNPALNGMDISGSALNIDNFSNNIAPNAVVNGNFVAPNTCGQ